jgi:hypothetical protein
VVRHGSAKPLSPGSNPGAASIKVLKALQCRCGGIGRRARLKIVFLLECRFDPDHRYHYIQMTKSMLSALAFFVELIIKDKNEENNHVPPCFLFWKDMYGN